jgi:hypothetical protein
VSRDQATIATRATASTRAFHDDLRLSIEEAASDASLWVEISSAGEISAFARAWLAIVGRSAPSIVQAAVLHGTPNRGPFNPVARWAKVPALNDVDRFSRGVMPILSAILEGRQPAVEATDGTDEPKFAGIPLIVDKDLHGVLLVEAVLTDATSARRLMRHLQWSSAWVEAFLLRSMGAINSDLSRRATLVVETLNAVCSEGSYAGASRAFVARLAEIFHCERVAFGHRRNQATRIVELFQSASFERRHMLGRTIEAAMDEAIDQRVALTTPTLPSTSYVAAAQKALAQENDGAAILTIPVMHREDPFGAVTLERFTATPFAQDELVLCDALCAAVAPVLVDKQERDWALYRIAAQRMLRFARRFYGLDHIGYKIGGAAVLAVGTLLFFATDTFRVHAHAQIQGEVRRIMNAPFDGYVRSQHARAGQVVREGELLAQLEDNDLALDRLRHIAQRRQYQLELDRALSKRDLAQANIAHSQVEQQDAEIELGDQMLSRAQLRAPFDAVVVSGDLTQAVGRPVSRGDVLFELAPLDRYRITLLVPEMEIQTVQTGQTGWVLLTALPERPFEFEINNITPVARTSDGVNGFEVLADLKETDPRLRPAMEGVAKIEIGPRSFIWIWTHEFVYWLRVKIWALIP